MKRTLLTGLLFLIPIFVLVFILIKAFVLMVKIGTPIASLLPFEGAAAILAADIIAILLILLLALIAGLVATHRLSLSVYSAVDEKLLNLFPRYAFIKSMAEGMAGNKMETVLKPVFVEMDDHHQIMFEVERLDDLVTVYTPGSPDPWSGALLHVNQSRVRKIDVDFATTIQSIRRSGVGINQVLEKISIK